MILNWLVIGVHWPCCEHLLGPFSRENAHPFMQAHHDSHRPVTAKALWNMMIGRLLSSKKWSLFRAMFNYIFMHFSDGFGQNFGHSVTGVVAFYPPWYCQTAGRVSESAPKWVHCRLANEQWPKPWLFVVYRGLYYTQLFRDYNIFILAHLIGDRLIPRTVPLSWSWDLTNVGSTQCLTALVPGIEQGCHVIINHYLDVPGS